jgi:hypothetical protein
MVKQGPVPAFVHSLIEYIAGIGLIAAPLLLGYDHGAATAASIVLGVLILFLVATTTSTMSLINQVPLSMHILFDYVITAIMIAAPFLFSFSGESAPTAVFIAGGVVWLLLSIGTRYLEEETPERGSPKRRRPPAVAAGARDDGSPLTPPQPEERPARVRRSDDAVPDEAIPEFEPPPRPE